MSDATKDTAKEKRPTLAELSKQSRALGREIAELSARKSEIDEAIRLRHKDVKKVKELAKRSPEEIDAVVNR